MSDIGDQIERGSDGPEWQTRHPYRCYTPSLCHKQTAKIERLTRERDEAVAEGNEQARLLGISGSREAALLSKCERLTRERDTLKALLRGWRNEYPEDHHQTAQDTKSALEGIDAVVEGKFGEGGK